MRGQFEAPRLVCWAAVEAAHPDVLSVDQLDLGYPAGPGGAHLPRLQGDRANFMSVDHVGAEIVADNKLLAGDLDSHAVELDPEPYDQQTQANERDRIMLTI